MAWCAAKPHGLVRSSSCSPATRPGAQVSLSVPGQEPMVAPLPVARPIHMDSRCIKSMLPLISMDYQQGRMALYTRRKKAGKSAHLPECCSGKGDESRGEAAWMCTPKMICVHLDKLRGFEVEKKNIAARPTGPFRAVKVKVKVSSTNWCAILRKPLAMFRMFFSQ